MPALTAVDCRHRRKMTWLPHQKRLRSARSPAPRQSVPTWLLSRSLQHLPATLNLPSPWPDRLSADHRDPAPIPRESIRLFQPRPSICHARLQTATDQSTRGLAAVAEKSPQSDWCQRSDACHPLQAWPLANYPWRYQSCRPPPPATGDHRQHRSDGYW